MSETNDLLGALLAHDESQQGCLSLTTIRSILTGTSTGGQELKPSHIDAVLADLSELCTVDSQERKTDLIKHEDFIAYLNRKEPIGPLSTDPTTVARQMAILNK